MRLLIVLQSALLLALLPSMAAALSLSPTRLEFDLRSTPVAEAELRIGGRPDRVQHIELSVFERLSDDRASLIAADSVTVELQPPQLVIERGGQGLVRVRVRRSDGAPTASRSYFLVVEPVEIADPAAEGIVPDEPRIMFVPRLHLPLHVDLGGSPAARIRRVVAADADADVEAEDAGGVIELSNRGNRYQRLATLRAVGPSDSLTGREIARRVRTDALLPGQTLRVPLKAGELAGEPLGVVPVSEP